MIIVIHTCNVLFTMIITIINIIYVVGEDNNKPVDEKTKEG